MSLCVSGLKDEPTGPTAAAFNPMPDPPDIPVPEEREEDDLEEDPAETEDSDDEEQGAVVEPEEPPLPTAVVKTPAKQGKLQINVIL